MSKNDQKLSGLKDRMNCGADDMACEAAMALIDSGRKTYDEILQSISDPKFSEYFKAFYQRRQKK